MLTLLLLFLMFSLHTPSSHAQSSCTTYTFSGNKAFDHCTDLPYLNSFLHWNYEASTKTVKIGYRQTGVPASRWVAWAINPTGKGMIGAQAVVAYQKSDGGVRAYTAPVTGYQTALQEGKLSFPVTEISATYNGGEYVIFATMKLDNVSASSMVNQVWQQGAVSSDSPGIHSLSGANIQSAGSFNLTSGQTGRTSSATLDSRTTKKKIHGMLNAVSWGILLPIGAIIARYLKVFPSVDPAWFYLHAACQCTGYIVGVAGWVTGLQLGSKSPGVQYTAHRLIGIVIFSLATLQMSALLLRPKKEHKLRLCWNIYHHLSGYSIIVLSIINIFKGFKIIETDQIWKKAYIGVLIGLAMLAATLEIFTWYVVLKRKKLNNTHNHKMSSNGNGNHGYNGYGARDRV